MPKPKEPEAAPTSFPSTPPPPTSADLSNWLFNASAKMEGSLGKFEGTLAGFQTQLNRVEAKLDAIQEDVKGHGKWIHTLKVVLTGLAILFGWVIVYAVVPWLRAKLAPAP